LKLNQSAHNQAISVISLFARIPPSFCFVVHPHYTVQKQFAKKKKKLRNNKDSVGKNNGVQRFWFAVEDRPWRRWLHTRRRSSFHRLHFKSSCISLSLGFTRLHLRTASHWHIHSPLVCVIFFAICRRIRIRFGPILLTRLLSKWIALVRAVIVIWYWNVFCSKRWFSIFFCIFSGSISCTWTTLCLRRFYLFLFAMATCLCIYFSVSSILNTSAVYYFELPDVFNFNDDFAIELIYYCFVRWLAEQENLSIGFWYLINYRWWERLDWTSFFFRWWRRKKKMEPWIYFLYIITSKMHCCLCFYFAFLIGCCSQG